MTEGISRQDGAQQAASPRVRDVNAQLQQQLSQLTSRMESVQSAWTGDAATAFHGLQQRWTDNANKLNSTLVDIADMLDSTGARYDATEVETQQSFSGITSALDG